MPRVRSVESREAILADYYQSGLSVAAIATQHEISVGSLYHYINTYGTGLDRGGRKYDCNDGLFDEPSERGAYWLGFYAADGHVAPNRAGVRCEVQLQLAKADRCVLEAAQATLETDRPISDSWKRKFPKSSLYVTSEQLAKVLLNFSAETVRMYDPTLVRHLIRGLMDGDGSVSCRGQKSPRVRLLAERAVLLAVAKVVAAQAGTTLGGKPRQVEGIWEWALGGICNVQQFRDWIYSGATIFLARKKKDYVHLTRQATPRRRGGRTGR